MIDADGGASAEGSSHGSKHGSKKRVSTFSAVAHAARAVAAMKNIKSKKDGGDINEGFRTRRLSHTKNVEDLGVHDALEAGVGGGYSANSSPMPARSSVQERRSSVDESALAESITASVQSEVHAAHSS